MDNGSLLSTNTEVGSNRPVNNYSQDNDSSASVDNTDNEEFSNALSDEMDHGSADNSNQTSAEGEQATDSTVVSSEPGQVNVALQAAAEQLQTSLLDSQAASKKASIDSNKIDTQAMVEQSKLASINLTISSLEGQANAVAGGKMMADHLPLTRAQMGNQVSAENINDLSQRVDMLSKTATGTEEELFPLKDLLQQVAASKISKGEKVQTIIGGGIGQLKVDLQLNNPGLNVGSTQANMEMSIQTGPHTTTVKTLVGAENWANSVFDRVAWLSNQTNKMAQIQLNPPELGPLEVRVKMNADQASVSFSSHHGAVRDAIEQAVPRLREMFAGQGINLADVNVSDQGLAQEQTQENDENQQADAGYDDFESNEAKISERQLLTALQDGLLSTQVAVDYYA